MHDGSHYATFDVTIVHYTLDTWEDFEESGIYEYVFGEDHVVATGYAGSRLYLDIPRNYFGVLASYYVSDDGTCNIIGEGVDDHAWLEKVAIIGPFADEEGTTVCAAVVYATDEVWTDDEFDVTIVDGIEENNLNVAVTIVSEVHH